MIESSIRKAIVTGGNSGIGKSIMHRFSDAGFKTAAGDINTSDDLPGPLFPVDLTRPAEIDSFCKKVTRTIGVPDILVCNAGRGIHEKLAEGDPDQWEHIFQLNVFSTFRLIRAFVPDMVQKGFGDVIFISSVSSSHAYPYGGIYAATKAAVDKLAETLRLEVQPSVRVTVIHPGVVDTNFFKNMINGTQTPESIGWGALTPGQVADAVLFAVNQPRDITLNDIVMRPSAQVM
ncbi:MAG: SDR family NAD(P)-dependent oxidoreductase [Balneolales bacterium]